MSVHKSLSVLGQLSARPKRRKRNWIDFNREGKFSPDRRLSRKRRTRFRISRIDGTARVFECAPSAKLRSLVTTPTFGFLWEPLARRLIDLLRIAPVVRIMVRAST
jgi:hypothetical protein